MKTKDESKKELVMLIKYMAQHNKSHNQELLDLLDNLKTVDNEVYEKVKAATEDYEKGNKKLLEALHLLEK